MQRASGKWALRLSPRPRLQGAHVCARSLKGPRHELGGGKRSALTASPTASSATSGARRHACAARHPDCLVPLTGQIGRSDRRARFPPNVARPTPFMAAILPGVSNAVAGASSACGYERARDDSTTGRSLIPRATRRDSPKSTRRSVKVQNDQRGATRQASSSPGATRDGARVTVSGPKGRRRPRRAEDRASRPAPRPRGRLRAPCGGACIGADSPQRRHGHPPNHIRGKSRVATAPGRAHGASSRARGPSASSLTLRGRLRGRTFGRRRPHPEDPFVDLTPLRARTPPATTVTRLVWR
jgi:hypothetical protein